MNALSPITQYIESFLKRRKEPMEMKDIVTKAAKKFPNEPHSKFWNAVHNNCVTKKPRFVMTIKRSKTFFSTI